MVLFYVREMHARNMYDWSIFPHDNASLKFNPPDIATTNGLLISRYINGKIHNQSLKMPHRNEAGSSLIAGGIS